MNATILNAKDFKATALCTHVAALIVEHAFESEEKFLKFRYCPEYTTAEDNGRVGIEVQVLQAPRGLAMAPEMYYDGGYFTFVCDEVDTVTEQYMRDEALAVLEQYVAAANAGQLEFAESREY